MQNADSSSTLAQVCQDLDILLALDDDSGLQRVAEIVAEHSASTSDPASPATATVGAAETTKKLLRAYGAARQVPKRIYGLEELRLNNIQTDKLLSPKDYSLNFTRNVAQAAGAAGLAALAYGTQMDASQVLATLFGVTFLFVVDQVRLHGRLHSANCACALR